MPNKRVVEMLMERYMYKSPDHHDPVSKIGWTTAKAAAGFSLIGALDCTCLTRPQNLRQGMNCMAFWVVPGTAFFASWAAGLFITAHMRKKEDAWNYLAASLATIPMVRYLSGTSFMVFQTLPLIILGSMIVKVKKDNRNPWLDLDFKTEHGIYAIDLRTSKEEDKYYRSPYVWKS